MEKPKKEYKVRALTVGGLNNKIFKSGDVVAENNFREGRADELVAAGFLERIFSPEEIEEQKKAEAAAEQKKLADEESARKAKAEALLNAKKK